MIRGLNGVIGNFVIATYATEKGIKGQELALMIPFLIKELLAIGYKVRFVNQDQSGVNRKAYDLLGANLEKPYFYVENQKVFTVFDMPHLVKSVSIFLNYYKNFYVSIFHL